MKNQKNNSDDERYGMEQNKNRFWTGVLTGALVTAFAGLVIVGMSLGIYLFVRSAMGQGGVVQEQPGITNAGEERDLDYDSINAKMSLIQQIIDQYFLYEEDLEQVEEIRIYDINQEAAQKYCQELSETYGVRAVAVESVEAAVRGADVINVATAGAVSPEIQDEWLKEGVLLTLPASAALSLDTMKSSRIVVDNWKMYEAYAQELRGLPGGYAANLSGICGYLMDLVESGEIPQQDIVNLGDVIAGKQEGRRDDQERVIFIMDGMPIEDLAWGYTVYEKAKEMGLGTKLNLWEKTC